MSIIPSVEDKEVDDKGRFTGPFQLSRASRMTLLNVKEDNNEHNHKFEYVSVLFGVEHETRKQSSNEEFATLVERQANRIPRG